VLAIVSFTSTAVSAISRPTAPEWSRWHTLRYEARPLIFFTGRVEMRLRNASARRLLETDTLATFLGAELARARSRTTIDPATGRTVEFYEITPERGRRYVFGADSFTVERIEPSGSWEAPVANWTSISKKVWPNPPAPAGGSAPKVYDYYGMLVALSDAPLKAVGDSAVFWVATSHGAEPYKVTVSEVRSGSRTITGPPAGNGNPSARAVPVRELRLRVAPADPAKADEGFLKMEGETEIWVESASRTLLQISGKIPKVPGRVDVELTDFE